MTPRLSLHTCDERAVIEAHKGFHNDDIHFDLANLTVRTALVIAGRGRSSDRKTRRRSADYFHPSGCGGWRLRAIRCRSTIRMASCGSSTLC